MKFFPLAALLSVGMVFNVAADSAHHAHAEHSMTGHQQHGSHSAVRAVEITMDDSMRFTPQTIEARQGETILLKVVNVGEIPHELVIGPKHELLEHAKQMRENTDMHHHHSDNAITLNAGESGELLWTFKRSGTLDFACLIPGHFEAGMKGAALVK